MRRSPRRPLALFVCCLFAGVPMSHGAVDTAATPLTLPGEGDNLPSAGESTAPLLLAALDDKPVRLRTERKFNVMKQKKEEILPVFGEALPVAPVQDDEHPLFIIADELQGRTEESVEAIGEVELRKTGNLLFADRLTYWPLDDEVDASGHVRIEMEGTEVDTPHLRMKLSEQIGFAEQATYRIVSEVASRFYQPVQLVATSAASNAVVAGASMLLSIPDSYGLPTKAPAARTSESYGTAERINFEGKNQFSLFDASYSTCKPGQTDWYLQGSEVHLDYDQSRGEASNASVWFKGVPLLYTPVASFALNHQRKSGFLHPSFSASSKNGFDIDVPYYWNIAPNYDAVLHPRYMANRGFQLGSEVRYLDYNYTGTAKFEYMAEDKVAQRQRYGYNLMHTHNLGRGVSAAINWNAVSDDLYQQDMSSRLMQTSQVQLPQQLTFGYAPLPWLSTSMTMLRYQTLQPDPANPVARPYFLEPQINVVGYRPNVLKTDLSLIGQYSKFTHQSKIQGERLMMYPQISLPVVHPAFQITPKIGVHMSKYTLGNVQNFAQNGMVAAPPESITRVLPTFSLSAGVTFERDMQLLGNDFIQTLEPQLYYVNIPYKDQSNIPVFDSGLSDFNFAQVFAENRYSGLDRINDANQLTSALTTRILSAETGEERFKAMIGQRYYFRPQQVVLPGEVVRNNDFSNLIAAVTGLVLPKTYADAAVEYDYHNSRTQRLSAGARYQPEYGKVLSASYRYTRDPLTTSALIDQVDVAGQWPLSGRWYAVGRYNYSLRDERALESVAGFEYNAGCWSTRFVAQKLQAIAGTPVTTLFFQLELNDFGSLGSNPIQLLRRTIPGYGKSNELPTSGSLLTTE